MGGYPSSSPSKNSGKIYPHLLTCESITVLDKFLLVVFENVNAEEAVRSLHENPLASQSLLRCMSSSIADKVEHILKRDGEKEKLMTSNVETVIQDALDSIYTSSMDIDHEVSPQDRAIFESVCVAFPRYLKSEFYYGWRAKETFEAIRMLSDNCTPETTLPELPSSLDYCSYSKCNTADACLSNKLKSVNAEYIRNNSKSTFKIEAIGVQTSLVIAAEVDGSCYKMNNMTIVEQALDHCDPILVATLLRSKSWLPIFLAMAETLPIGISLSRVYSNSSRFPVVYLNRHLENLLGYKRKSIVENNWDFLHLTSTSKITEHGDNLLKTQQLNLIRLSRGLADGQSTIVTLTNRRYNGEYFKNIVGIKPVLDESYSYNFVIGIHIDSHSSCFTYQESYNFLNQLIDSFPKPEIFCDIQSMSSMI
eukprot:gene5404-10810_t